jgi:gliding motility-associated-like protein
MQSKLKLFLPVLLLLISAGAWAQVSTGSLGDPVFTFDFGSGDTPQYPVTGYQFVAGSCPNDGQYSISKTETGCHDDTWHKVFKDHTGNDGYMMVVNADATPNQVFFSKQTPLEGTNGVLCENTQYEFSAYILNLIKAGQSGFIQPRVTFIIETLDGDPIGSPYTVDIPETSNPDGWTKYATYFTTPVGVNAVVVKMVNNAPGGNGNDLLLDDIAFRAFGPDVKAVFSGDASMTAKNVCVGSAASYDISATPAPGYSYQWQKKINGSDDWVDMIDSVGTSIHITMPSTTAIGDYQYRFGVAKGGNITSLKCRVYSNAVTISVTAYPDPPPFAPRSVCEGEPLILSASGGASYKWTGPNLPETFQNPLIIPNATAAMQGRYHVEVISAAGCSTPQDVDVTVNLKPVIQLDDANPSICRGSGKVISASSAEGKTYSWFPTTGLLNPNSPNPFASPDVSTLYTVTVTGNNDCTSTAQVQVDVVELPVANAGNDKKIFEGQSIKLDGSATGNVSYIWSPPEYLNDPHSLTPMATPPTDKTYTLTVVSENCGTDTSSVFIRVYNKLVIPTTFTPNNDAINDVWNIEALETYPLSTISVYTRNGKLVFQSKGYGKAWDGKLDGNPLPTGTYYYVIDLKNDTPSQAGWVMLLR